MFAPQPIPIRSPCPPGACSCGREELLSDPQADGRILRLTREEEKRLIAHIEGISAYGDLKKLEQKLHAQLGVTLTIRPGPNEVRTVRGLVISLEQRPGLCKKTRQTVPAALRRCLDRHPELVFAILNAHDLLGMA